MADLTFFFSLDVSGDLEEKRFELGGRKGFSIRNDSAHKSNFHPRAQRI